MRYVGKKDDRPAYVMFMSAAQQMIKVALISMDGKELEWKHFSPSEVKLATRYAEALAKSYGVKLKR